MLTLITLATVGCGVDSDQAAPLSANAAALPQPLSMTIADPLLAGEELDLLLTGAPPNTRIKLIRSTGIVGAGACPAPLNGECLDITPGDSGYIVQTTLTTDASGQATFNPTLPSTLPIGFQVARQTVVPALAVGSNPIGTLVADPLPCTDDALEDNDDILNATLSPATPLDAISCDDDDDDFGWTVPPGQGIAIDVTFDDATDGDIDIALYNATNAYLDGSRGSIDTERITWLNDTGAEEVVFLRTYLFRDNGGPLNAAAYTVDVAFSTQLACIDDVLEDDDDATAALPMLDGDILDITLCDADSDWFS